MKNSYRCLWRRWLNSTKTVIAEEYNIKIDFFSEPHPLQEPPPAMQVGNHRLKL
jgi:hypothetical protein